MDKDDRVVAIVGIVLVTSNPTQILLAGLLFVSPEYATFHDHEKGPTEVGVAGEEDGITPLVTVTVEMVGMPEQALPV